MEKIISKVILEKSVEDLIDHLENDVVIVGAGPSGLTAAKYLAEKGFKVLVLEKRLSIGGGICGGGSLFHKIVVDDKAGEILDDFKISRKPTSVPGLYALDAVELASKLASGAIDSGAKILTGWEVEDLIVRENPARVVGVVAKWAAIMAANLHVDPLFYLGRGVIDATGHEAVLINIFAQKNPDVAKRPKGERSAFAEKAEVDVVSYTGKVAEGLYATGMAVASLHGLYRMGPIFTGMLLSGRKIAEIVARDLGR